MKKPVTKIICAAVAAVVACGAAVIGGCSSYNSVDQLDYTPSADTAVSNGGFAVEKGGYVYFVNGVENNTADNTFGTPVKGSIMRISTEDLGARNYSSVRTVVPHVAYSGNYDTGIFVYGDYVYYSTPSVSKTSDGAVQNSKLDLKRTKLDGTESMKDAYITFQSLTTDFRYVEADGTVYILYVLDESLYGESTAVKNLHSLNTSTGADTLLAYNISGYIFDKEDKSNPRVYYTMNNFTTTGASESSYNQLFTVTADVTEENEYDTSSLVWWNDDSNRYINCGDFVFDGIGKNRTAMPFNYVTDDSAADGKNALDYTYTLESYQNGTLFYTRHSSLNSTAEYLFSLKDSSLVASRNPVNDNAGNEDVILLSGASADGFKYVFKDGNLNSVISTDGSQITVNYVKDGKLAEKVDGDQNIRIATGSSITLLFVDGDYLYYSASHNSNNGYTFFRVNYTGRKYNYEGYPDDNYTYTPVAILDLDAATDWYMPEFFGGTILFASETTVMTSYNYIMAFNVGDMTNADIKALNEKYEGITGTDGIIGKYSDTDKYPTEIYANLPNAARYLFYTGDIDYVKELAAACNAELGEDDDPVYSDQTITKLTEYLNPTAENEWKDYTDTVKVNGQDVYANRHDYYYSVVGRMTDADAQSYTDGFRTTYLREWPEEEQVSWWGGLNTVARVFFIIGMCVAGLLVIAGITVGVILIVRKKKGPKQPAYTRRRIKVDVTDDKSVNVYGDDEPEEQPAEATADVESVEPAETAAEPAQEASAEVAAEQPTAETTAEAPAQETPDAEPNPDNKQ